MKIDAQVISNNLFAAAEKSYSTVCDLTRNVKNWTVAHKKEIATAAVIAGLALTVLGAGMMVAGAFSGTLFAFTAIETTTYGGMAYGAATTGALKMGALFRGMTLAAMGLFEAATASKALQQFEAESLVRA